MRLETNHSGILNFLWGVFGWQKWSGIAASPRIVRRPDHRATVAKVQGALDNALLAAEIRPWETPWMWTLIFGHHRTPTLHA
jgi:hypothetical protein